MIKKNDEIYVQSVYVWTAECRKRLIGMTCVHTAEANDSFKNQMQIHSCVIFCTQFWAYFCIPALMNQSL